MAIKDPRIVRVAKIELIGGQAKPGPALASIGINMADFTRQFNDQTKDKNGQIIPCVIYAYKDKSFKFETKTTPTAILIKKAAKVDKGGKNQITDHVGTISKEQALEIANYKLPDLNANDVEAALRMVAGTAKQMGIKITDVDLTPNKNKGAN